MILLGHLDRYILRAVATPFAATLVLAVMLLSLEQMLRLFDFLVTQGGPAGVVWQMLIYLVPQYIGLVMPLGLFLGVLLAFRRLSLSSELDALLASGLSLRRLLAPVYALCLGLVPLHFMLVGFLQPLSHYRYSELRFQARSGALGMQIRVGEFASLGDGLTIWVGAQSSSDGQLRDIFVRRGAKIGDIQAIRAERGTFLATQDAESVTLRLFDGQLIDLSARLPTPGELHFASFDLPIALPQIGGFRPRGTDEEEATTPELIAAVYGAEFADPERGAAFRAALHFRLILSVSLLIMPALAAALALTDKRRDKGLGPVLGVMAVIVYHELLQAGETTVALGRSDPWSAMWSQTAGVAAISFALLWLSDSRPGVRIAPALKLSINAMLGALRRRERS